jgi:hypothetical protein
MLPRAASADLFAPYSKTVRLAKVSGSDVPEGGMCPNGNSVSHELHLVHEHVRVRVRVRVRVCACVSVSVCVCVCV